MTGHALEAVRPVRGLAAIAMLNLRCAVVLLAVNAGAGAAFAVAGAGTFGLMVAIMAVLFACVPIALIGYPAGLVTAHLLGRVEREQVHVAVFAAVGAVLAAVLLAAWADGWGWAVLGLVEGALGAGGARWWSGKAHRRAAARPARRPGAEPEDALIDAQLRGDTDATR